MGKWLTKSDYMKFLAHPAYLWLAKYAKDKLPEFNEVSLASMNQGNAVEAVAVGLFAGAREVDVPMFDGPDETARLMRAGGPEILLQGSVLTRRKLYARSDVLVRQDGNAWDLYEIKAAASVKDYHLSDLAFQKLAFAEAGHKIGRSFVVHINSQYQRSGEIDPKGLFTIAEVTDQVDALEHDTVAGVEAALAVMSLPQCPPDAPALSVNWYNWRDIYRFLHPEISADSILNLTRLSLEQIQDLAKLRVTSIADIPEDFALGPKQQTQVEVVRTGVPHIHHEKIAHSLGTLAYPLYFLDYETFASAIPMWDGVRAYQQLPFQYSLHIIEKPGGPLVHKEYLARGKDYPVVGLLEHMKAHIGDVGSVIVWSKSFEMGCNDAMGALHPEFADFLAGVNARVYDLMEIFANGWYAHPGFMGSASIKKVLPVLVPELSYKDLGIGEGMTAQIRWMRAARGELSAEEASLVYDNLVEYCGQDTLAMVRIYEHLSGI